VRRYMAHHAYGNTVSDDLWHEVDLNSAHPLTGIAHDFTLQAGIPMVNDQGSACENGATHLTLTQTHFAIDADSTQARVWHVPVRIGVGGASASAGGASESARRAGESRIVSGAEPQALTFPGCGPVVLNEGHTGYYRSHYASAGLKALAQHLAQLPADDGYWLLADTYALASSGEVSMPDYLALVGATPPGVDPTVSLLVVDQLADLDRLYDGLAGQEAFRRFAIETLEPVYDRVGWHAHPGEPENDALLRADVIEALAQFGDTAVLAQARERFEALEKDPTALSADLRSVVLKVMALRADPTVWEQLHAMAKASDSQLERLELYKRLGEAQDPALAERALQLAISGEPPATVAADMVRVVGAEHARMAVDFAVAHWQAFLPVLEPNARARWIPRIAQGAADPNLIATLDAFAAEHIPANARQALTKAESNIRYRASIRAQRLPAVSAWIAQRAGGEAVKGATGR